VAILAIVVHTAATLHAGMIPMSVTKVPGGQGSRRGHSQSQQSHSQKLEPFHRRILL